MQDRESGGEQFYALLDGCVWKEKNTVGWVAAEDSLFIVFSRHLLLVLRLLAERLLKASERLLKSGSRPGKCSINAARMRSMLLKFAASAVSR